MLYKNGLGDGRGMDKQGRCHLDYVPQEPLARLLDHGFVCNIIIHGARRDYAHIMGAKIYAHVYLRIYVYPRNRMCLYI